LDVRLSLDLDLQKQVDAQLGDRRGAAVLLNAGTGEVLAMASHPAFDPNKLDEIWDEVVDDPLTPLLNRAMLGQYQIGAAIGPILMAAASDQDDLPGLLDQWVKSADKTDLACARPNDGLSWRAAIGAGCLGVIDELAKGIGETRLEQLYQQIGISPQESGLTASPLQMALAAATLSSPGLRPSPQLTLAYNSPLEGWLRFPEETDPAIEVFSPEAVSQATSSLAEDSLPIWQSLAVTPNGPDQKVSWYLGGTLPTWEGAPLALVVLLEEDDAALAESIGQEIFRAALSSR
jgi:hypothetical protein